MKKAIVTVFAIFLVSCSGKNGSKETTIKSERTKIVPGAVVKVNELTFEQLGVKATPIVKQFKIQKILPIPGIKEYPLADSSKRIISYRTEYHNGTMVNGCVLVLCEIKSGKLRPLLVLDELFLLPETEYMLREITKFSYEQLEVSLYKVSDKEKERLLDITYKRQKNGLYMVESYSEIVKGNSEYLESYFSVTYGFVKGLIMEGKYEEHNGRDWPHAK